MPCDLQPLSLGTPRQLPLHRGSQELRQRDRNRRTLARFAVDRDRSIVRIGDRFDKRKPQAAAALLFAAALVDTEERLKDAVLRLLRNASAAIGDREGLSRYGQQNRLFGRIGIVSV